MIFFQCFLAYARTNPARRIPSALAVKNLQFNRKFFLFKYVYSGNNMCKHKLFVCWLGRASNSSGKKTFYDNVVQIVLYVGTKILIYFILSFTGPDSIILQPYPFTHISPDFESHCSTHKYGSVPKIWFWNLAKFTCLRKPYTATLFPGKYQKSCGFILWSEWCRCESWCKYKEVHETLTIMLKLQLIIILLGCTKTCSRTAKRGCQLSGELFPVEPFRLPFREGCKWVGE